ncbi:MAG: hypothetical protein HC905_04185 [Bacteroidales bacterium]|nr:hypothetical protein [Bacteroidales bacterium]
MFNRTNGKCKIYSHQPRENNSLPSNDIRAIFQDSKGELWIGTANGLATYNAEKDMFITSGVNALLPNKVINGILEDSGQNLWISTNKGLVKYNVKTAKARIYDISDGLQGNDFNYTSQIKSPSTGQMIFGGPNGMILFHPEKIDDNPVTPPIALTGLKIAGKEISIGDTFKNRVILKNDLNEIEELKLLNRENNFEIEFAALNFISPFKNQYKYMLEGSDKDWIEVSSQKKSR